jgi:hypothetical protein
MPYIEQFIVNPEDGWTEGYLKGLLAVKYGKDHKKIK